MQLFVHDESTTSVFRPRHPIVSGLDILGMAVTMFFLSLTAHVAVQSYLISLLLLYFFSMLHHWLSYADWRRKIDHMMIFVVIAMTAMPYWGGLLPFEWAPLGPLMIISIVTIGVTVKLFTFMEKKLSGVLYMAAGLPMVFDFAWSWESIPTPWNTLWMVGIGL